MFCNNCGKELSDNVNFCSHCGSSMLADTNDQITVSNKIMRKQRRESAIWQHFKRGFMIFRCVCCFTTIFSILGPALAIYLDRTGKINGFLETALFVIMFIGFASTIFACPLHTLKICLTIITIPFMTGVYFYLIGALIFGTIGLGVSIIVLLFGSCFISIPYFFTDLIYEI